MPWQYLPFCVFLTISRITMAKCNCLEGKFRTVDSYIVAIIWKATWQSVLKIFLPCKCETYHNLNASKLSHHGKHVIINLPSLLQVMCSVWVKIELSSCIVSKCTIHPSVNKKIIFLIHISNEIRLEKIANEAKKRTRG